MSNATASTRRSRVLRLPAAPPFDFTASLRFITSFPAMTGEQGTSGGALTLALRAGGVTLGARLTSASGPVEAPALDCELAADEPIGDAVARAAADRLGFHLSLADDIAEFSEIAEQDPPFAAVARRLRGYHQVKFPSPAELLCWAILCQRTPLAVARQARRGLIEAVGNSIDLGGVRRWAFPDLAQLLALGEGELRAVVGSQRKAGYLFRSVRRWAELDEGFLRTGPYDAVRELLLELPGIGPWSASFLLIRGLGRMERVEFDKELGLAVERVYGRAVDEVEFRRLAARYGVWQGYWGHYLRAAG